MKESEPFINYFRHAKVYYDRLVKDIESLVAQNKIWHDKVDALKEENKRLYALLADCQVSPEELTSRLAEEREFLENFVKKQFEEKSI